MLDLAPLSEKHGVLADIRGEVRYTLEVSRDQQDFDTLRDRVRCLHHVGQHNAEHGIMEVVHFIVCAPYRTAQLSISAEQGVDRVAEHTARETGHGGDLCGRAERL